MAIVHGPSHGKDPIQSLMYFILLLNGVIFFILGGA